LVRVSSVIVLRHVPNLIDLNLFSIRMTDAGLQEVAKLKHLTDLDLKGNAALTEKGLKALAAFKNLTTLAGNEVDASSHRAQKMIEWFVVVAKIAGPQPTGNGTATLGEQHTAHRRLQPPGESSMQRVAELVDPI
jgi:hypothetical protein